jgi:queuosine precursor transporter
LNEISFIFHILVCFLFLAIALRWGKGPLKNFIILNGLFANLFVFKQIELFGLTVTCSDVYAVGFLLGLNFLQEFFGLDEAKKTLKISFFSFIFLVAASQIHLHYVPSIHDSTQSSYAQIFSHAPRILASSIVCFYLIACWDLFWFSILKKYFNGRRLELRIFLSLFLSQFLDTFLFSFAALYGIVASVWNVIFIAFSIKATVIVCSSFLLKISKKYIRDEHRTFSI